MNIWFTADWHLSHFNIIRYTGRPFKDVNQMDHKIIKNYCELVGEDDVVFFVGDLSMRRKQYKEWFIRTFERLPGTKHLILGNHDYLGPFDYIEAGFTSVHTSLEVQEFILVHDPAVATVAKDRKFVCGHVHGLFKRQGNVVNVGVDIWDFKPVDIDTVRKTFEEK